MGGGANLLRNSKCTKPVAVQHLPHFCNVSRLWVFMNALQLACCQCHNVHSSQQGASGVSQHVNQLMLVDVTYSLQVDRATHSVDLSQQDVDSGRPGSGKAPPPGSLVCAFDSTKGLLLLCHSFVYHSLARICSFIQLNAQSRQAFAYDR